MGLRAALDLVLASAEPLQRVEEYAWQSLVAASRSSRHPWSWGVFSTIDICEKAIRPRSRTVILRSVDPTNHSIDLHTDSRSAKVNQLQHHHASWLFYAEKQRIQLRVDGKASLIDGQEAEYAWQNTSLASRSSYLATNAPGTPQSGSQPPNTSDRFTNQDASERGREFFRVIRTNVESLEVLYLRRQDHVRFKIDYSGSTNNADVNWLEP
ncbi:MAG: hypothetical protein AAF664_06135 [Planctomycetota bacterium]